MKDTKMVIIFIAVGLILAYFVGAPLRRSDSAQPQVGTPLDEGQIYAEGTISIDPSVAVTAQNYPALFLFVRAPESRAPIAVKRIANPVFPLKYKLTDRNNMAGEGFFDGDISVVARLDANGSAGPKEPNDLEASVPIAKGAGRQVDLAIK